MDKLRFKDRQVTGNVGLFFICYNLSRMGWNVLPTSRNAKGIDILAYGKHGEKFLTIQAKGYTQTAAIGPFIKRTDVIADFYIVACDVYCSPRTYILSKNEVELLLTPPDKKGYLWVQFKDYGKPDFLGKWDKVGFGFFNDAESEMINKIDDKLNKDINIIEQREN